MPSTMAWPAALGVGAPPTSAQRGRQRRRACRRPGRTRPRRRAAPARRRSPARRCRRRPRDGRRCRGHDERLADLAVEPRRGRAAPGRARAGGAPAPRCPPARRRRRRRGHGARDRRRRWPSPGARGRLTCCSVGRGDDVGTRRRSWTSGRALLPAGHRPQQVGQPVEVGHDERRRRRPPQRVPLGPAHDGAGEVEPGRRTVLAGHDELGRRVEALVELVDRALQRVDHLAASPPWCPARASAVLRQRGQLGHEHPQVAHRCATSSSSSSRRRRVGPGQAEHGLGLVDLP